MKKFSIALIAGLMMAGSLSSCSSCYDCSQEVEIEVTQPDGSVTLEKETATDEFCTASNTEVEDKETEGFVCTRQ